MTGEMGERRGKLDVDREVANRRRGAPNATATTYKTLTRTVRAARRLQDWSWERKEAAHTRGVATLGTR